MNPEVKAFIACIDIVQNAVDSAALNDHIKTNYKKEIVFLNALDFADQPARASKLDNKSGNKTKHDGNASIIKGIKSKIDSDLSKLGEAKRKAFAAYEKQRSSSGKSKKQHGFGLGDDGTKLSLPFEGIIDAVYIILNYPYLPQQLTLMQEIDLPLAMVAFVPPNGGEPTPFQRKPQEKSARVQQKKVAITGIELDSSANPNCYPPARWVSLRPSADPSIPFIEVRVKEDIESTFKAFESHIVRVSKGRNEYIETFAEKKFIDLPIINPVADLTFFSEYLLERPNDLFNALYYQLKMRMQKQSQQTEPVNPVDEGYLQVLNKGKSEINRKVVFLDPKELPDPDFPALAFQTLFEYLYQLKHWTLNSEDYYTTIALSKFIGSPTNFHAYAGQRFDSLFTTVNKKYSLQLPLSFFDWQHWTYSTLYEDLEIFAESLHANSLVEVYLDRPLGILWVLTLPPVPRTMGLTLSDNPMPPSIDGITEFLEKIYDHDSANDKKLRNPPSPAQIIRENLDPSVVLPPISQKIASPKFYKLPLDWSNSTTFKSPYYFESKLKVEIVRTFLNGKWNFRYDALFKDAIDIFGTDNAIILCPVEGLRIMVEYPYKITIMFNEQSIYFDSEIVTVKSSGEEPIIITNDGTFITSNANNQKMIVHPNGGISRFIDGRWMYVDVEGETYVKTLEGTEKIEQKHSKINDIGSDLTCMIRPDNIEYYIRKDGSRRILFSLEYSIEQTEEKFIFDIPNIPVIIKNNEEITMSLDRFQFSLRGREASIKCPDYEITISEDSVFILSDKTEAYLRPQQCEFKYNDQVLIANAEGIEKMVQVDVEIPAKKKIVVYDTHWGKGLPMKEGIPEQQHFELHQKFVPRFFAICSDMSSYEFLRPDSIVTEGSEFKYDIISHPTGENCNIVTIHHETRDPLVYVESEPLTKAQRSIVMKSLQIPKPKKQKDGQIIIDDSVRSEADGAIQSMYSDNKMFLDAIENLLETQHNQFLNDIKPRSPPPVPKLPLPPPTPPPRMLEMQANINQPKAPKEGTPQSPSQFNYPKKNESAILNYWGCKEAEFAMPDDQPRVLERPLSARVSLYDPPREDLHELEKHIPQSPSEAPQGTRVGTSFILNPNTASAKKRPVTVKANPEIINFGTVKANCAKCAQIVVTNTGTKPVHYSVTQPNNQFLKVLTIPGVVYPGLKMTLKVALLPAPSQYISTSFTIKTNLFDMNIPVTVQIVD